MISDSVAGVTAETSQRVRHQPHASASRLLGRRRVDECCRLVAGVAASLFVDGAAVRQIGPEVFRVCNELVDDLITVSNDEICAAVRDCFEDTRAMLEPAGAISVAGAKKYLAQQPLNADGSCAFPKKRAPEKGSSD